MKKWEHCILVEKSITEPLPPGPSFIGGNISHKEIYVDFPGKERTNTPSGLEAAYSYLGNQGWELVSVVYFVPKKPTQVQHCLYHYFKRPAVSSNQRYVQRIGS